MKRIKVRRIVIRNKKVGNRKVRIIKNKVEYFSTKESFPDEMFINSKQSFKRLTKRFKGFDSTLLSSL